MNSWSQPTKTGCRAYRIKSEAVRIVKRRIRSPCSRDGGRHAPTWRMRAVTRLNVFAWSRSVTHPQPRAPRLRLRRTDGAERRRTRADYNGEFRSILPWRKLTIDVAGAGNPAKTLRKADIRDVLGRRRGRTWSIQAWAWRRKQRAWERRQTRSMGRLSGQDLHGRRLADVCRQSNMVSVMGTHVEAGACLRGLSCVSRLAGT